MEEYQSYYALFLFASHIPTSSPPQSSSTTTSSSSSSSPPPSSSSLSSASSRPSFGKFASIFRRKKEIPIPSLSAIDDFWNYADYQAEKWSGLHITLSDFAGKCDSNSLVKHNASLSKAVLPEIRSALYGNATSNELIEYRFSEKHVKKMKLIRLPSGLIAIDFNIENAYLDKLCNVIHRNGVYGVRKENELKEGNKKDGLAHRLHGQRSQLHMSLGNIADIEFIKKLVNLNINPITELPAPPIKSLAGLVLQSAPIPEQLQESLSNMTWEIAIVKWNNIKEEKRIDKISYKEKLLKIKK